MRQVVVEEAHYLTQFLKTALQNYSPDYEEYFARKIMWCWDQSEWHCTIRTEYWNANSIPGQDSNHHKIYYCSTDPSSVTENGVIYIDWMLDSWCVDTGYLQAPYYQSYGQYARQYTDVWTDANADWSFQWDIDDVLVWMWPVAIPDNIQELYMIDTESSQRIFLRRVLTQTGDWNKDWLRDPQTESTYALQILKLYGLDAWSDHGYTAGTTGMLDTIIDTRVCDAQEWFECNGTSLWWLFSWFTMPKDKNDWWVILTNDDVSILDRYIRIHPQKDPFLATQESNILFAPVVTIDIVIGPSPQKRPTILEAAASWESYRISVPIIHNTQQRRFE